MASAAAAPITLHETSQQNAANEEVESITITHEQIAQRARKIWEREGRIGNRDQEHWFQAIAELTSGFDPEKNDGEDDDAVSGAPLVTWTARHYARDVRSRYSV